MWIPSPANWWGWNQIPPGLSQASYCLAVPPQHAFCALHSYPIILWRIEPHSLSEVCPTYIQESCFYTAILWHAVNVSKKSHGVMQHTRWPWTSNVWISSRRIPPILSTPCSTTILATTSSTSVWRTAITGVFRPQWYGDPVSVLGLCLFN